MEQKLVLDLAVAATALANFFLDCCDATHGPGEAGNKEGKRRETQDQRRRERGRGGKLRTICINQNKGSCRGIRGPVSNGSSTRDIEPSTTKLPGSLEHANCSTMIRW